VTSAAQPLATFAVIAYNQERFIREAVEGALSQTYAPLEVVLSDDCSTDRTFDIIREMAAAYLGPHRVVLNRNESNLGLGAHINRAVSISQGRFLVMAAGDDISLPQRTARLVDFMQSEGRDAFAVYSDAVLMSETGETLKTLEYPLGRELATPAAFARRGLMGVPGFTQAFRREVFERFGPLHERLVHEDSVIPFRALLLGRIARIAEVLVRYRVSPGSIMRTARWGTREGLAGWHRRSTVNFVNCIADATRLEGPDLEGLDTVMRELLRRLRYHHASQCIARSIPRFCAVQARWLPLFGREAARSAGSALKIAVRERLRGPQAGGRGNVEHAPR
jgi:glycosyltransferase involved in cell wall biosynthesis